MINIANKIIMVYVKKIKVIVKNILPGSVIDILCKIFKSKFNLIARLILIKKFKAEFGQDFAQYVDIDWKSNYKKLNKSLWTKRNDDGWEYMIKKFIPRKTPILQYSNLDIDEMSLIKDCIIGNRILDAGCGMGRLSIYLAKHGFEVTGMDCSSLILEYAKKNTKMEGLEGKNAWKLGFMEDMPFSSNEFNTIICAHSLDHVQDLDKSISELKRVANQCIIIIVPLSSYNYYTPSYQTHFFSYKEKLIKKMMMSKYKCFIYNSPITLTTKGSGKVFSGPSIFFCGYL